MFSFFEVQLWQPYMTTKKTIALTIQTFVSRIMFLIFITLPRFVIAFLWGSNFLLISWLQSPSAVTLEPKEEGFCHHFHLFPFYLPWSSEAGRILKSRDITLPTKVCLVKAMVFPVIMYGCETWTIKKADCQRIDAFELWCWRRLLRVLWTARRSNQSILKEINPGCSLEGLVLKLKLQ